ncbi:MAG: hypothetical protein KDK65_00810, partial [Chlamydiia bacterium]|nr:hypothetical protein [Chlamydiia bacterium]
YADIVAERTRLDTNRTIKSLNDREFKSFLEAIEYVEGWKVGKEDFIERWIISGVHKKRGVIFEYCLVKTREEKWVLKSEAVHLAKQGLIQANLVQPSRRTPYLRPYKRKCSFACLV